MTIPLVAHRGYAQNYPENTRLALAQALQRGACYIEFDVQLTLDQVPVVLHDASLCRTANDWQDSTPVMALTWDQVKGVAVGEPARFGDQFSQVTISALVEVVELLRQYPHAQAFVEIKAESVNAFSVDAVVSAVLAVLQPVLAQCVIIAFQAEVVTAVQAVAACQTGWVLEQWSVAALTTARHLAPDYLFVDDQQVPDQESLWPGPWRWVVYDITEPQRIQPWQQRGADLIETWDIGRLLPYFSAA